LITFVRILISDKDWQRAKRKGEIAPTHYTRLDRTVLQAVVDVLVARAARYTTRFEVGRRIAL
jgi:hypothetical protein